MYQLFRKLSMGRIGVRAGVYQCPRCGEFHDPTHGGCPKCADLRRRVKGLSMVVVLLLGLAVPGASAAQAAKANACYVITLRYGQYVTQTSGAAGTIHIYVNGAYRTTIYKLNQPWYATSDKSAVVRGYDGNGVVC